MMYVADMPASMTPVDTCCVTPLMVSDCAILVGVRGLEPPTSASRTLRASRLRYTPELTIRASDSLALSSEPF